ncbi:hypothetical protein R5R35_013498 [Gryllus longicercus]|uniref:Accessory gland protein n=1 Tax=Gryllus longicercus TaxID=2509291 RepID=A0AAN9YZ75_9ORTH
MRVAVVLLPLLLLAVLAFASARPEEGSVVLQAADAPLSPLLEEGQALSPEERERRDVEWAEAVAEDRVKRSPQRRRPRPPPGRPRPRPRPPPRPPSPPIPRRG